MHLLNKLTATFNLFRREAQSADATGMGLASKFIDRFPIGHRKQGLLAFHDQKRKHVEKNVLRFRLSCSPSPNWPTLLAILFEYAYAILLEKTASHGFDQMLDHSTVSVRQAQLAPECRGDLTWAAVARMAFANIHAPLTVKESGKIDRMITRNGFEFLSSIRKNKVRIAYCHAF